MRAPCRSALAARFGWAGPASALWVMLALPALADEPTPPIKLPPRPEGAPPAPPLLKAEPGDDEVRRLLKEQHNSALVWFDLLRDRPELTDLGSTLEQLLAAQQSIAETGSALATNTQEKVRVRENVLKEAKEIEANIRNRVVGGVQEPPDYERTRAFRLGCEVELLKIKAGANDPGVSRLLKEQLEAARKWYDLIANRRDVMSMEATLEQIFSAQQQIVDSGLGLAGMREEKVKLLEQHIEQAKKIEKDLKARDLGGLPGPDSYLSGVAHRVQCEIRLLKLNRPEVKPSDPEVRRLLTAHVDAAMKQYKLLGDGEGLGVRSVTMAQKLNVQRRMLESRLALSATREERLRLCEEVLAAAKEFEAFVAKRYEGGLGEPTGLYRARCGRLELEVKLAKEKQTAVPPESPIR